MWGVSSPRGRGRVVRDGGTARLTAASASHLVEQAGHADRLYLDPVEPRAIMSSRSVGITEAVTAITGIVRFRIAAQSAERLIAVHAGELDVHQDQGGVFAPAISSPSSAVAVSRVRTGGLQDVAKELGVEGVVFDDEDQLAAHDDLPPAAQPAASGRVKLKVLPRPSSLSTQMRPPCSSTNRCANARPKPVPSCLRV